MHGRMDEDAMIVWINQVLCPHIESAPPGVLPIIFLDSYRCHMMASVVSKIQDLGVEVEHIPGGCDLSSVFSAARTSVMAVHGVTP